MKKTIAMGMAMLCLEQAHGLTVTVTNNLDSGLGSLRQAVVDVNASVDPSNRIHFNLTGAPPIRITLTSAALPPLAKQVTIDGTTQPGWALGTPAIALSCPSMIVTGLMLAGPPSEIRGLRVQDFTNSSFNSTGIGLTSPGHRIADCQVISNYYGITIHSTSNTIGGAPAVSNRNVISGNRFLGIQITSGAGYNVIVGNYIGTDPTGSAPMGNGFGGVSAGISILSSPGNLIGGNQGAATRNVVSGNNGSGIFITGQSGGADRNVIIGNYIGLDAAGTAALTNTSSGVSVVAGVSNRVGGAAAGEGNVISGNAAAGVSLNGTNTFFTLVQGNLIGPFADGVTAPPAASAQATGVQDQGARNTTIGGSAPGARNVVSGNRLYGIRAELAATGCTIQGNLVGLQGNGTAALANGLYGVAVARSTNTTVQGNLIGGNTSYGVHVSLTLTTGTVVRGNFIGTDATGTLALPNVGGGMLIDGANDVRVGGTNSGDGNVIAFNAGRGVAIITNTPGAGVRNALLGNRIYGNLGIAIDLDANGANPNDAAPDTDNGANGLQNHPVVTNAQQGSTTVQGFLVSATSLTFRCEFFATNVPQGMLFLGASNLVTSAGGTAVFTTVIFPLTLPTSAYVCATATDPAGNTSELSPGARVKPAIDSDADGLWDSWEVANFGTLSSNGTGNADGDALSNYQEFIADTSPTNAAAVFELDNLTNALPHHVVWNSSASRWYDLEFSTDLHSPTWFSLASNVVGVGGPMSFADGAGGTNRLYRARAKLP
jgi:hypothetical protein